MVRLAASASISANTSKLYSYYEKVYLRLCKYTGIPPYCARVSEFELCILIVAFTRFYSTNSIPTFLSALQRMSHDYGWGALPKGQLFRRVRKGLKNLFAGVDMKKQVATLFMDDLQAIISNLHTSPTSHRCPVTTTMKAILLFNWWCGARRSEVFECLTPSQVSLSPAGVRVTFPVHKGSYTPTTACISRRLDDLDLHTALSDYVLVRQAQPTTRAGPFLFQLDGKPVKCEQFVDWLRGRIQATLGIDPSRFTNRSLRRGLASSMYEAGVPEPLIMHHGRWRSLAVRDYLELSTKVDPFQATKLLTSQSRHPPASGGRDEINRTSSQLLRRLSPTFFGPNPDHQHIPRSTLEVREEQARTQHAKRPSRRP